MILQPAVYTVLLVDDQPDYLLLWRYLLAGSGNFAVVGEARSGHEAVALMAELGAQVALVDVQMPGWNGFETTRRLLTVAPHLRIVLVSASDEPGYLSAAHQVGAAGFLLKQDISAERLAELL